MYLNRDEGMFWLKDEDEIVSAYSPCLTSVTNDSYRTICVQSGFDSLYIRSSTINFSNCSELFKYRIKNVNFTNKLKSIKNCVKNNCLHNYILR